jgi:hypothetical protein
MESESFDYSERLREAIRNMVQVRGQRGVRADQHLGALAQLVREIFVNEGFAESDILVKGEGRNLKLPGYFRPTKDWDLLVVEKNVLAAAIEFKSQMGSVGKNVNNRAEEAIGSGTDVWEAHREGRFGLVRPWVGYFLVLGEEPGIDETVGLSRPRFPIDEIFRNTSYVERYEILCKRLVNRRVYDAACLIVSTNDPSDPIREPSPELNFDQFATAIRTRAQALAALRGEL